jgi:chemotaxis protein MotA
MTLITPLGFIFGIAIFSYAIRSATTDYMIFYNVHGLMIVLGGTIAAMFIGFPFEDVRDTFVAVLRIFATHDTDYGAQVSVFSRLAEGMRAKGIPSLEEETGKMKSSFLKDGLTMIINGNKKEEVRENLETLIQTSVAMQEGHINMFKAMGIFAPAFGLTATLIGLIIMLKNMGTSIASIGPAFAIALNGTFYGVISSNFLFQPISEKLKRQMEYGVHLKLMQMDGILMLMDKRHPLYIIDRLNMFIEPKYRVKAKQAQGGKGK